MSGTILNALLVVVGSFLGLIVKEKLPSRYQVTIMQGLAIVIGIIGVQMAIKSDNIVVVIVSIAFGTLLGEILNLDLLMEKIGAYLAALIQKIFKNSDKKAVGESFVTTTLIYCVGAMAVLGSIQEGLTGDGSLLYAKALIDGITSIFFASTLGIGVIFSAVSIFLYQGTITFMAGFFINILSEQVILEMTATGGVLIIGISLNMLKLSEIKIANMLPSILLAVVISYTCINYL